MSVKLLEYVGERLSMNSYELLEKAVSVAKEKNAPYKVGNILSSDIFYNDQPEVWKKWAQLGCLGVEMESYALYTTAASLGKKALCILTVSSVAPLAVVVPILSFQE